MRNVFVSVIVPVFNNLKELKQCLEALSKQRYCMGQVEILVVNNDPRGKLNLGRHYKNVKVINEVRPGSYAARNAGIQQSKGDILGFCDSDCIPSPNWISNAVSFLITNQNCQRLAGNIVLNPQDMTQANIFERYEKVFAFRQSEYVEAGAGATANMFAWRHVFDAVGLFNAGLYSGGDLEWGQRAQKAGYAIGYAPNVVVQHPARNTLQTLVKKARRVISGYMVLNDADIRKNPQNALYHGFSMLKPPVKAGPMIFAHQDLQLTEKMAIYGLEYYLKLIQLQEFIRLQLGGLPKR